MTYMIHDEVLEFIPIHFLVRKHTKNDTSIFLCECLFKLMISVLSEFRWLTYDKV